MPAVEGGVACTQQPRLAAPAPSLLSTAAAAAATSGAVTRPPVKLQLIHQSGALHAVSVPTAQANASGEAAAPKAAAAAATTAAAAVGLASAAQTANNFRSNQSDSAPNSLHTHNAAAGENSKVNSSSAGSHPTTSPNGNSSVHLNGPGHPRVGCKRLKKWNFDRSFFNNVSRLLSDGHWSIGLVGF